MVEDCTTISIGGGDVYGCMDMDACNYNADATSDDGSCDYPSDCSDCDGGGTCEVVIMGYDGTVDTDGYCNIGDAVTFKIYDASDNIYHDATPSEDIPWSINGYNLIDHLIAENLHTIPLNYILFSIYGYG